MSLSVDDHLLIAKKVWCPLLLVIEFEDGPRELFNEVILKTLKEHNAHMEYFMLPGTHQQHLNAPESVNTLITQFVLNTSSKL